MAHHADLDWPMDVTEQLIEAHRKLGGFIAIPGAGVLFCRPSHAMLARLRSGEIPPRTETPDPEFWCGPNVYSFAWWGNGLKAQMKLARRMLAEVGPGGVYAWHTGDQYQEHHPDRRRALCPQP